MQRPMSILTNLDSPLFIIPNSYQSSRCSPLPQFVPHYYLVLIGFEWVYMCTLLDNSSKHTGYRFSKISRIWNTSDLLRSRSQIPNHCLPVDCRLPNIRWMLDVRQMSDKYPLDIHQCPPDVRQMSAWLSSVKLSGDCLPYVHQMFKGCPSDSLLEL